MPPAKNTLQSLAPLAVSTEAMERLLRHLSRLAFKLTPTFELRTLPTADELAQGSDLGLTLQTLTLYAQTGRAWDWEGPEEAVDAIQTVVEALFSGPEGDPVPIAPSQEGMLDANNALHLVLLAAWARAQVGLRQPVTAKALSCLAGVDVHAVDLAIREGELQVEDPAARPRLVVAESARAWLEVRGAPGFR